MIFTTPKIGSLKRHSYSNAAHIILKKGVAFLKHLFRLQKKITRSRTTPEKKIKYYKKQSSPFEEDQDNAFETILTSMEVKILLLLNYKNFELEALTKGPDLNPSLTS